MAPKKLDDKIFDRPLPADLSVEKIVLGCLLLDDSKWEAVTALVDSSCFSIEPHRIIFSRMAELHERGERIDRVTVATALRAHNQLDAMPEGAGLSYLVSLDQEAPDTPHVEEYCRVLRDHAHRRRLIYEARRTVERAYAGVDTPQEIAGGAQETLSEIATVQVVDEGRTPQQIIETYPGGVDSFLDPTKRRRGLPTGLAKLDEMTNGLHAGELIVIGARPGVGKSSMLLGIAEFLCLNPQQRRSVAIFSLEMTGDSLLTRLLCSHARVDSHKFRSGFLNQGERYTLQKALFDITESRLKIYDKFGISDTEIAKHVKRLVKEEGLHCAGVDYLQLCGTHGRAERRDLEISQMTRRFKILAGECGIPLIVLSQLSRANEKRPGNHRPILSDLRESGGIENDADMVFLLHREELYASKTREDVKGTAELIVAKNRHGPGGIVSLRFLAGYTKFVNANDEPPQEET